MTCYRLSFIARHFIKPWFTTCPYVAKMPLTQFWCKRAGDITILKRWVSDTHGRKTKKHSLLVANQTEAINLNQIYYLSRQTLSKKSNGKVHFLCSENRLIFVWGYYSFLSPKNYPPAANQALKWTWFCYCYDFLLTVVRSFVSNFLLFILFYLSDEH